MCGFSTQRQLCVDAPDANDLDAFKYYASLCAHSSSSETNAACARLDTEAASETASAGPFSASQDSISGTRAKTALTIGILRLRMFSSARLNVSADLDASSGSKVTQSVDETSSPMTEASLATCSIDTARAPAAFTPDASASKEIVARMSSEGRITTDFAGASATSCNTAPPTSAAVVCPQDISSSGNVGSRCEPTRWETIFVRRSETVCGSDDVEEAAAEVDFAFFFFLLFFPNMNPSSHRRKYPSWISHP
ncbi:cell wall surface anchor family protein [Ostreococcus tauri]|uniref:Cell wall surface anchor family protein n=1 Tax=Ostreococcus tauri TaxID=70448 RepID=A0A1Y5I6X8_OSTTA|nr:cell wall surface anchor family protein [Ostreococcus tauri]